MFGEDKSIVNLLIITQINIKMKCLIRKIIDHIYVIVVCLIIILCICVTVKSIVIKYTQHIKRFKFTKHTVSCTSNF